MILWILFAVVAFIVLIGLFTAISAAPILTLGIAVISGTFLYLYNRA